jgi:hypothetical protein
MTGYTPTHIGIPKNHADFERKCVVLFQELLGDPTVKRLGRSGQRQFGIDLLGYRGGNLKKLVGIQCKKKQPNKTLTSKEVRSEVRKALKHSPLPSEYIIVTTAPDDTNLDKLAAQLTKQQLVKGRKVKIQVWGWDTLEDYIDRYPAAKDVFDPGASPALKEVKGRLDRIAERQSTQATAEQVAQLVAKVEQRASVEDDRLPPKFADIEISAEMNRINKRRGFAEAKSIDEWAFLAQRILEGDLSRASAHLQADALERAARSNALSETVERAKLFHSEALKRNNRLDTSFYEALLPAAEGDPDKTLRALRELDTPQARSAFLGQLIRNDGTNKALEWIRSSDFGISDFDAGGSLNLLLQRRDNEEYDQALREAESLSAAYLKDLPALCLLRSGLLLASVLPRDQRHVPFQGMPINPRMLRFSSLSSTPAVLSRARADLEVVASEAEDLRLVGLRPHLSELILWLKLENKTTRDAARQQIEQEIKDPRLTLDRVRLALAYDIPFNQEALKRTLHSRREFGNWTREEQFAAFLLAWHNRDLSELVAFFDAHREELYAQETLDRGSLLGIEIQALSRAHRFDDARTRLAEGRETLIDEKTAAEMEELIASVEAGDEAERLRKLYESTADLGHLRLLIEALVDNRDHRQLATYAPILLKESHRIEDYGTAQKALFASGQYQRVVALAKEYSELHELHNDFVAVEGWAYFYLGKIIEARDIARILVARREDSGDRELDINTSVESGDWSHLQAIVAREVGRVEKLDAKLLMRLARIAFESGSLYVDRFRDAAIEREPNSPEILLAAYQLSVERGEEYQESRAHEWLQKAVELSGENGPVETVSLKDVVSRSTGWSQRVDNIDTMLAEVKIPLYMAARSLNRQPIEFILGTAIRNAKLTDVKQQFPVLAFSGSRTLFDLTAVRRLALDPTTILTLEFLGILQKTIGSFDQIVISPTTLSSLFAGRQSIRFRQPTEVVKAREIKKLLADGRLKVIKTLQTGAEAAALEIDPDLVSLLDRARATKGIVIRSAPVHKLRSFLEEEATLAPYSDVLTDTHAALSLAQTKVSASIVGNASTYLSQVDKGWPKKRELTKSSTVYLDQLAVTYLYHVGVLEAFVGSVAAAYVSQEVEDQCNAVLQGDEFSSDLLAAVERIRAILNAGLEKGNIVFSARRIRRHDEATDDDDEMGNSFPSLDILSNLSGMDAIAVDDRFLNKETVWSDGNHRVVCVSTLEIILALNERGVISEAQKYVLLHRLREGGYYAVPTEVTELLAELARSTIEGNKLIETKELATIRTSLTIALRSRMHSLLEGPWIDHTRGVIFEALRRLWSDDSPLSSTTPRADWLLAVLPTPARFLKDPADDAQWLVTVQKAGASIGLMLSPPMMRKERQVAYSSWIEERLAAPARVNQPALLGRAIKVLSEFFRRMLEPDKAIPLDLRKHAMAKLAMSLHPNVQRALLDASNVAGSIGLKITPLVVFNGSHALVVESFVAALRLALARKKLAVITMSDGSKRKVKLQYSPPGTVTIAFNDAKFTFTEADLLTGSKAARKRALRRIFAQRPLTAEEEKNWFGHTEKGALSAKKYTDLVEQLRSTPESVIASLVTPQRLNAEKLIPVDLSYYVRLVGPVQTVASFADYLQREHKRHREFLLSRGSIGLRRLAYSAVSRSLVPFEELEAVPLRQLAELLTAEDPFSLVFGFEVCQHRLGKGQKAAAALGTKFLRRLLGDEKWLQSRLELFSACAVIGAVTLRPAADELPPPLSWFRLAIFAHAGVLTTALRGIKKPSDFLKWAAKDFGSTYLWHTVIDARDDPRWESEWMGPGPLKAEVIGRCQNALRLLPTAKQPEAWKELIGSALDSLDTKLLAHFPGPLDGFLPSVSPVQAEGAIEEIRSLLRGRASFRRVPGIVILAYAGAIDARLKDEIFRLLEASNEQLAKFKTADHVLRCCAYIAAITRDAELANAVVVRCLRLISPTTKPDAILRLLLISMRACGANSDLVAYYREAATIATRFAYSVPLEAALEMRKVLETMKCRDLRLAASFGRAEAVLEAFLLSG